MGIWGSVIKAMTGRRDNLEKRKEAKRNREFQQYNSDTAYQRAMKDMKAGGLNPMLVAKVGAASTPSGAMANLSNAWSDAVDTYYQSDNTEADTAYKEAQTELTELEQQWTQSNIDINAAKATLGKIVDRVAKYLAADSGADTGLYEVSKAIGDSLEEFGQIVGNNREAIFNFTLANMIASTPVADRVFDLFGGFGAMLKSLLSRKPDTPLTEAQKFLQK